MPTPSPRSPARTRSTPAPAPHTSHPYTLRHTPIPKRYTRTPLHPMVRPYTYLAHGTPLPTPTLHTVCPYTYTTRAHTVGLVRARRHRVDTRQRAHGPPLHLYRTRHTPTPIPHTSRPYTPRYTPTPTRHTLRPLHPTVHPYTYLTHGMPLHLHYTRAHGGSRSCSPIPSPRSPARTRSALPPSAP